LASASGTDGKTGTAMVSTSSKAIAAEDLLPFRRFVGILNFNIFSLSLKFERKTFCSQNLFKK
jgi:hypothetical protein